MGMFRHECIVVNDILLDDVKLAHAEASRIFGEYAPLVSPVVEHVVNGGGSFFVAPDGSKCGWDTSNDVAELRRQLIGRLRDLSVDFAVVQIGGDPGFGIRVIDSSDEEPS